MNTSGSGVDPARINAVAEICNSGYNLNAALDSLEISVVDLFWDYKARATLSVKLNRVHQIEQLDEWTTRYHEELLSFYGFNAVSPDE